MWTNKEGGGREKVGDREKIERELERERCSQRRITNMHHILANNNQREGEGRCTLMLN